MMVFFIGICCIFDGFFFVIDTFLTIRLLILVKKFLSFYIYFNCKSDINMLAFPYFHPLMQICVFSGAGAILKTVYAQLLTRSVSYNFIFKVPTFFWKGFMYYFISCIPFSQFFFCLFILLKLAFVWLLLMLSHQTPSCS